MIVICEVRGTFPSVDSRIPNIRQARSRFLFLSRSRKSL